MKTKLYKEIAKEVRALQNCIESNNNEWRDTWAARLDYIAHNYLPSGSGIDSGCTIETSKSNDNRLVIYSSYHCMDEHGYYDGWVDFRVVVKPSLQFGINMNIIGNFGKYSHLKDYLYDIFEYSLSSEFDTEILNNI